MPELPEVENVRQSLRPLLGRRIVAARLFRPDICRTFDGALPSPAALLEGAQIVELARRGKRLAFITRDGRTLVVHLGMTGHLRLLASHEQAEAANHIHARWEVDDGSTLLFRDPRRFGGLWTMPSRDALSEHLSGLGPDALDIDSRTLSRQAGDSRRAIKAVLLDQRVLAGVGNIYADEALFRAGIRPTRKAHRLTNDDWRRLAAAIRRVLLFAVRAGGSTLRDYRNASGKAGSAQRRHAVYGRAGQACIRCRRLLRGIRLTQRATVFCPNCQR